MGSSPSSDVLITPAAPADADGAAETLVQAFLADPHMTGSLPTGDTAGQLRRLFGSGVRSALRGSGHVYLAVDSEDSSVPPLGVAVWEPPTSKTPPLSALTHLVTQARVYGSRLPDALRNARAFHAHHPKAPHWFLAFIGARPEARGRGVGSALIRQGLAHADAESVGVYLESSSPDNLPYYRKFGFHERGVIPAYGTSPAIGMWRPPSST
ncbi:GNAT family N-acetyltransferase [Nesterenkonia flava]|uniref:GNAT family N-acetyltransferase n=1 Tax=Nesterenkonia flava TaxID=469799 RepID=A0ABU1FTY5_9MICC|nr:GNAT family N-acetyltransferase [Nesterenkonia flava]MDR5712116.1 GNAT family N-acetyltransferase [Nesterenkonia flava]